MKGSFTAKRERVAREKITIRQMIQLYCRHKQGHAVLCQSCIELSEYACNRLDNCRYGNRKCSCKSCTTHCYAAKYREDIRAVMRYSGPRMFLHHPISAIRHLIGF